MGEVETLKEISGELAVIREALESAEISERMLTGIHRELEQERNDLRAEVERLRGSEAKAWEEFRALSVRGGAAVDAATARAESAESIVAGLRRALEEIGQECNNPSEVKAFNPESGTWNMIWAIEADVLRGKVLTALAATSDEHARRIKAEALRNGLPGISVAFQPVTLERQVRWWRFWKKS